MGLLTRTPRQTPVVMVDVVNAERFDRMGLVARLLTYVLAQERYAYMKAQHRLWKQAGLHRAPAGPAPFNPFRGSHWMGRR